MRKIININKDWGFIKDAKDVNDLSKAININLPHTFNNEDGYDGGNDYLGAVAYTLKTLAVKN